MLEEEKMIQQQEYADEHMKYSALLNIPYFMLNDELENGILTEWKNEFAEIAKYYHYYKHGVTFTPEGSNGNYIPSSLKYKKAAKILNKEARFAFANPPTFNVNKDAVDLKYKEENAILQKFLDKVLQKTNFNGKVIKGLKDCFIGKRVAIVLNINEESGITLTFLNSMEFIYETTGRDDDGLIKFVSFNKMNRTNQLSYQRWFKKKYIKTNDGVFLTEEIWGGDGKLIETISDNERIRFDYIPVIVVLNDGLTGEFEGQSELEDLLESEKYYSKLANADMDAERKSMNPILYTIDANETSTKRENLSTSPGSYWDIQSNQDEPEVRQSKIGVLESNMNYSEPLKTTLERIENDMYTSVDVPNMTNDQLSGIITSGKTIRALYWGLTVRCDEKMRTSWEYALQFIATAIIEGGMLYPNCISRYIDVDKLPDIPFEILVENNYALPDDVNEEKTMDIAEVESKVMSRKSYLKKWRKLNDELAEEELAQIKLENEMFDDSYLATMYSTEEGTEVSYQDAEEGKEQVSGKDNNARSI